MSNLQTTWEINYFKTPEDFADFVRDTGHEFSPHEVQGFINTPYASRGSATGAIKRWLKSRPVNGRGSSSWHFAVVDPKPGRYGVLIYRRRVFASPPSPAVPALVVDDCYSG